MDSFWGTIMASDKNFHVESSPQSIDVESLEDHINSLNIQRTGFDDYLPLAIFVRNERGEVEAGVCGFTWGGCCEIKTLWVHEVRRGQGLGKSLLVAAEREALARGCRVIVLDTHSFQAPEFYQKLRYTVVGVIEDYPHGLQKMFLKKQLTRE
jgi:GNAT superfamily N-acetyltransferase